MRNRNKTSERDQRVNCVEYCDEGDIQLKYPTTSSLFPSTTQTVCAVYPLPAPHPSFSRLKTHIIRLTRRHPGKTSALLEPAEKKMSFNFQRIFKVCAGKINDLSCCAPYAGPWFVDLETTGAGVCVLQQMRRRFCVCFLRLRRRVAFKRLQGTGRACALGLARTMEGNGTAAETVSRDGL